jgi:hypothetical protein
MANAGAPLYAGANPGDKMYALFYDTEVYRIDDILQPEPFFRNLHLLLGDEECTLGLFCDLPNEAVKGWIRKSPGFEVPKEYDFRTTYEKFYRKDFPDGAVVYLHATPEVLGELTDLASSVQEPYELCSHVIAFGSRGSLFSFHDAFATDEMLLSIGISAERVAAFSSALGLPYRKIWNPQWSNPEMP